VHDLVKNGKGRSSANSHVEKRLLEKKMDVTNEEQKPKGSKWISLVKSSHAEFSRGNQLSISGATSQLLNGMKTVKAQTRYLLV